MVAVGMGEKLTEMRNIMAGNDTVVKSMYAAAIAVIEETLAATTDTAEQDRLNTALDDLRLRMEHAPESVLTEDAPSTDETTSTEDTTTSTEETPA